KRACSLWPQGAIPADFLQPVKTSAPVLLLSGQWDPATPPSDAERVAQNFSNSLPLVVPQGGHNFDGLINADCVSGIVDQFIASGTTHGLDSSCLAGVHRAPFIVTPPETKVVALSAEQLQAFAGTYSGEVEANVKVKGNLLEIDFPGDETYLLAPVSQTRF